MTVEKYSEFIGQLIGKNDLKTALQQLHLLLKNSPRLSEAIIQSSRYSDIMERIRLGTVNFEDGNVTLNKIRMGILSLLEEIEEQAKVDETIRTEVEGNDKQEGTFIQNSKNIINNSTINVGGDFHLGDKNT